MRRDTWSRIYGLERTPWRCETGLRQSGKVSPYGDTYEHEGSDQQEVLQGGIVWLNGNYSRISRDDWIPWHVETFTPMGWAETLSSSPNWLQVAIERTGKTERDGPTYLKGSISLLLCFMLYRSAKRNTSGPKHIATQPKISLTVSKRGTELELSNYKPKTLIM